MQVSSEAVSNISRRLNVSVPSARINQEFEKRLKQSAKKAKINGFRPGKVPLDVVRREFGAGIYQETVNDILRDSVFEAIEQEKINAVSMPSIEKVEHQDDALVYEALVEVYPEVTLNSFDGLEIERHRAEVTDADVDTMLQNLQKQRQTWTDSDEAAQNDDQVIFDFEGSIDGEKFDGGSAQDFSLVLGSGRMIPGFEAGIVGMKKGEEKTIDVTFPEDYQAENLAGKQAQFKITVKNVQSAKIPEIDDEFLQAFGITAEQGIAKLKADVRKNMEREVKNGLRSQVKDATFEALLNANDIDVPQSMIKEQVARLRERMVQQFVQQFGPQASKSFDSSLLPDELFEADAVRSAKLGVLVSKVLADSGLQVDQDRVSNFIEEMASSYEDPQEVVDYFSNDKQQRAQIENVVLEEQIVDHILQSAKVSDKSLSYQDLLQQQQARQGQ